MDNYTFAEVHRQGVVLNVPSMTLATIFPRLVWILILLFRRLISRETGFCNMHIGRNDPRSRLSQTEYYPFPWQRPTMVVRALSKMT